MTLEGAYRQRHPEQTAFYQCLEDYWQEFKESHPYFYEMDALDWIALVTSHIPNPHEQRVRYYGWYSNASRGKRRKNQAPVRLGPAHSDSQSEEDSEADHFARERRRNWARLLKKIYQVDPLVCPRCGNKMRILAFLEGAEVIHKILQSFNLWERPERSPPPKLLPHKLEAFLATPAPEHAQPIRASTDSV
ncbi:MAG: transposase, partial [Acidobacteria bacterium]|nr:transposase [Acidobacteriota bacterium]